MLGSCKASNPNAKVTAEVTAKVPEIGTTSWKIRELPRL